MSTILRSLGWFFFALSATGLVLSFASHVAAILGLAGPLDEHVFALHVGIFVVGVPAALASNWLNFDFPRKHVWRATFRGCPPWMRYVAIGIVVYLLLSFAWFIANAQRQSPPIGHRPFEAVRVFSGQWMLFYTVATSILYSALHVRERDAGRRCTLGHSVGPLAEFCERCDNPAIES